MPLIPVTDIASVGVVKDIKDYLLPPNAWTDSRNIRFRDGKITRSLGHKLVFDPPTVDPYWLLHVFGPVNGSAWIYAGLAKVYTYINGAHTDITRAAGGDYSATADTLWNGGILGGIPILNNGNDKPQFWSNIDPGQRLQNLTNWPATHLARVIRPFKNFLVAMDISEGATRYNNRVRTSHPAQPGGVPASWDDTDATKDVTVSDLTDIQAGGIVDGLTLRDTFVVYKERSTWGIQFVGGQYKMRYYNIFQNTGALGDHCIGNFSDPPQHFVFTGEDIIRHDGQQITSVIDKRVRRWIVSNIDSTAAGRSFVVIHADEKECWTCIPTAGSSYPNLAIIWDMLDGTITYRELDQASFIWPGTITADVSDPWDSDTGNWDSDMTPWDNLVAASYSRQLVQAKPTTRKLFQIDQTQQFNGSDFDAFIERTGLSIVGAGQDGVPVSDRDTRKLVKSIYPSATGGPCTVYVGRQHELDGSIQWGLGRVFTPGTDIKVDVLDDPGDQACRLFGVRFEWPTSTPAELGSWAVDLEDLGAF